MSVKPKSHTNCIFPENLVNLQNVLDYIARKCVGSTPINSSAMSSYYISYGCTQKLFEDYFQFHYIFLKARKCMGSNHIKSSAMRSYISYDCYNNHCTKKYLKYNSTINMPNSFWPKKNQPKWPNHPWQCNLVFHNITIAMSVMWLLPYSLSREFG